MNINATLIGQSIAFLFFVWFCLKYIWPPITKALKDRQQKIADGLYAAERAKTDLVLAQEKSIEKLREAREQAQQMILNASKRADLIIEEAQKKAQSEVDRIHNNAIIEIEKEVNEARNQLKNELAELAILATKKIIKRELNETKAKEVVDQFIATL